MVPTRSIAVAGVALCVAAACSSGAWAGKLTVLQSFGQTAANGFIPQNIAVGQDGALYGATESGGANNHGAIYRLTKKNGSWTEDVLYSFGSHSNDGNGPNGIVMAGGVIFGTTRSGGKYTGGACSSAGCGTIFEIVSKDSGKTWTESIVHNFKGFPTDGATPRAGLLADKGDSVNGFPTFYGTTTLGGSGKNQTICGDGQGCGTMYELTREKSGWKVTMQHEFKGTDGFSPETAPTIDKGGNLYVSTPLGGKASSDVRSSNQGPGKLLKKKPFGPAALLYIFGGLFGLSAAASPDPNGYTLPSTHAANKDATSVIGTAYGGGASNSCTSNGAGGCGTVYLLTEKRNAKATWGAQLVHKFQGGKDGAGPIAGLTLDSSTGIYYGVSSGEESPSTDVGTIFALTPSKKAATGYEYSALFRFNSKNGAYPQNNLTFYKGVLYGTTGGGGKYAFGTVFSYKP